MSVTVPPMVFEVIRLFGGFFLPPSSFPTYFFWLDALSYMKYVYVGLGLNELQGLKIRCTTNETSSGKCITDGETTIENLGFDYINIGGCIGVLFTFIIVCRIISYLGVRFLKH